MEKIVVVVVVLHFFIEFLWLYTTITLVSKFRSQEFSPLAEAKIVISEAVNKFRTHGIETSTFIFDFNQHRKYIKLYILRPASAKGV